MIGTQIKIRNHDTGEEITLNDHSDVQNVIALTKFPTFENDMRAQNIPRQGTHGEYRMPYYYSGMSIAFQGVIAGETEADVWGIKRTFDSIMRLSRTGYAKTEGPELADSPIRLNECSNPRGVLSTAGWEDNDATVAISGLKSLRVTTTSASDDAGIFFTEDQIAKVADVSYGVAVDVKNAMLSARQFVLSITAYDEDDGMLATESTSATEVAAGFTERLTATIDEMPADTAYVVLEVTRAATGADTGDVFEVSRVMMTPAVEDFDLEAEYFDGDSPDLTLVAYVWEGESGLSASGSYRQTLGSMSRNTVRISFTDPFGKNVFIDATPIKAVSYDRPLMQRSILTFQILLRSNFPALIEDNIPEVHFGQIGSIDKGFKVPFELPFKMGEQYIKNAITITADTPSYALIRLFGSDEGTIVNPTIVNLTNGTSLRINRSFRGSDSFFLINGMTGTVTDEDGVDITPYCQGDMPFLDVGDNVLLYYADDLISD